jgi:hypothetical protein
MEINTFCIYCTHNNLYAHFLSDTLISFTEIENIYYFLIGTKEELQSILEKNFSSKNTDIAYQTIGRKSHSKFEKISIEEYKLILMSCEIRSISLSWKIGDPVYKKIFDL